MVVEKGGFDSRLLAEGWCEGRRFDSVMCLRENKRLGWPARQSRWRNPRRGQLAKQREEEER